MLAAYKLFHGKKEMSFPSKHADSNRKERRMVKTCFFRKPEVCRHQSALVITPTQHRAEGERELQCSSISKLSQSPGSSEAAMSLQGYTQWEQMGQAFVLLHQTVTEWEIPWGKRVRQYHSSQSNSPRGTQL